MSVLKTQALLDIESQPALIFFGRGGYVWFFFLLSKEKKLNILKTKIEKKKNRTYIKHTND